MKKQCISLFLMLLALYTIGCFPASAAESRPNVILIYSDDQGSLDLGCYGTPDVLTPHIDSLAQRGLRLNQMYAPGCVCSPSRAGLLTGRFPPRAGVASNIGSARGNSGLPADELTIATILRESGYRTGHFGKWHLGYDRATMPNAHGFDHSFGHLCGCIDNFSHTYYWAMPQVHDLWRNGVEEWRNGEYYPQIITDDSLDFFEDCQKKNQPFFAYVAYNVPHYPVQPTDAWREKYQNIESLDVPIIQPIPKELRDEYYQGMPGVRGMYTAFIASMDEQIGRILRKVDELGLRENTIIIFQADQGHSVEERTMWGGGYTGPYRGHKGSLFEGGIRVPSVISWPSHLPQGETRDQLLHACDWLPTLLKWCGAEVPSDRTIDGIDVQAILKRNAPTPSRVLYWNTGGSQWAVRQDDWKLVCHPSDQNLPILPEDKGYFLVNIVKDPGERVNFAKSEPQKMAELLRLKEEIAQQIQVDKVQRGERVRNRPKAPARFDEA